MSPHLCILLRSSPAGLASLAALPIVKLNDAYTPGEVDSWWDACNDATHPDYKFGSMYAQDGDPNTIVHSGGKTPNPWFRVDLLSSHTISHVRIVSNYDSRPDIFQRDDANRVWVGDNAAAANAAGNVMCSVPAGYTAASQWRQFECSGLVGRYVWVRNDCSVACYMNFGDMEVYGYKPAFPSVYQLISLNAPGDFSFPSHVDGPTTAARAVDGNVASTVHTAGGGEYVPAVSELCEPLCIPCSHTAHAISSASPCIAFLQHSLLGVLGYGLNFQVH